MWSQNIFDEKLQMSLFAKRAYKSYPEELAKETNESSNRMWWMFSRWCSLYCIIVHFNIWELHSIHSQMYLWLVHFSMCWLGVINLTVTPCPRIFWQDFVHVQTSFQCIPKRRLLIWTLPHPLNSCFLESFEETDPTKQLKWMLSQCHKNLNRLPCIDRGKGQSSV